jgi:hypothetical protein
MWMVVVRAAEVAVAQLWPSSSAKLAEPDSEHPTAKYEETNVIKRALAARSGSGGNVYACQREDWSYVWVVRSNPARVHIGW